MMKDKKMTVVEIKEVTGLAVDKLNPKAPQISFEDEFYKQPIENQMLYLKKLSNALNQALDMMQNERNDLLAERAKLIHELEVAEQSISVQKVIHQQLANEINSQNERFASERKQLQNKIREYMT